MGPSDSLSSPLSLIYGGPSLVPWRLHSCGSGVLKFSQAWFSCLCRFLHHDLDLPSSYITFSISLDFRSSAWCLIVDLCISFHQLLDESFMMIVGVFTKLITGKGPKDAQSYYKDTFSTMFIEALFIMPRTWKQPRCSWTKDMVHLYNGILLSSKIIIIMTSWKWN